MFSEARDTGFFTNLGTIAGRGAVRYAHKSIETDPEALIFLLSANRGLNELHVFAHAKRLGLVLERAIARCRRSERFLQMYGVPPSG